ncbi:hypothetical protein LEP1GSC060_0212 [Leptospira weilii serovar Ranarum str. ICFT]|uniref:Uncharacterized protein n=1 Tax=Leptospira weilii serovar Ranarum str. ICFT TaxID=1218598 RepID=N1WC31_9LEPT|nr:hypothetical protein LEP1GSC060_0212 [Leptospira weilii serovar Ranarum str. ICFT]
MFVSSERFFRHSGDLEERVKVKRLSYPFFSAVCDFRFAPFFGLRNFSTKRAALQIKLCENAIYECLME